MPDPPTPGDVLRAVQTGRIGRARKGQWLPDWNLDGVRVDWIIRALDDADLIDAPARDAPTVTERGLRVLDIIGDGDFELPPRQGRR